MEAIKDGSGYGFIECAAKHSEPFLEVQPPGQRVGKISSLSSCRERFHERIHGRANVPPCFNGAGSDTSALGSGISEEFVMFPM